MSRGQFILAKAGRCAMCPADQELQPVALWPNGLTLCEAHQGGVNRNHRDAYKNHPLRREEDSDAVSDQ